MKYYPLNLHIRLTTACNARCDYCSCESDKPSDRMNIAELEKSLDWALRTYTQHAGVKNIINIEVLGGELLILPTAYLREAVAVIKQVSAKYSKNITLSAQSNLIGSQNKINALLEIFNNAVGSSLPTYQRKVKDSSKRYTEIYTSNANFIKQKTGETVGNVIVVDHNNIGSTFNEYLIAKKENKRITLRPVYQGAHDAQRVNSEELGKLYQRIINDWFLAGDIVIDPFLRIIKSMLHIHDLGVGCAFWNTCAGSSLDIEPNGDMYVCQEMADAKLFPIGNTISQEWNQNNFLKLAKRRTNVATECQECQWYQHCKGGCMMESYTEQQNLYAKPGNCVAWKIMFETLNKQIKNNNSEEIQEWIRNLESYNIEPKLDVVNI